MSNLASVNIPAVAGQAAYSNIALEFSTVTDIFASIIKQDGTGINLVQGVDYNVTSTPSLTVTLTNNSVVSALTAGDTVRVFRDTNVRQPVRVFSDGSVLRSDDLNAGFKQVLFAQQEVDELSVGDALRKDATQTQWDATSLRITNVADAVSGDHAVTLGQVNAALATSGNNPSVPQSYTNQGGSPTLTNGTFVSASNKTEYTMNPVPTSEFEQTFIVELNGVIQRPNIDFEVNAGTTANPVGTLTLFGGDFTNTAANQIQVNNFGLSRQVFDFPVIGESKAPGQIPIRLRGHSSQTAEIFRVENSTLNPILSVSTHRVAIFGRSSGLYNLLVDAEASNGGLLMAVRTFENNHILTVKDPDKITGAQTAVMVETHATQTGGGEVPLGIRRHGSYAANPDRGPLMQYLTHCTSTGGIEKVGEVSARGRVRIWSNNDPLTDANGTQQNESNVNQNGTANAGIVHEPHLWIQPYRSSTNEAGGRYILVANKVGDTRLELSFFGGTTLQHILGGSGTHNCLYEVGRMDVGAARTFQFRSGGRPNSESIMPATGNVGGVHYFELKELGASADGNRRGQLRLNCQGTGGIGHEALSVMQPNSSPAKSSVRIKYDGSIEIDQRVRSIGSTPRPIGDGDVLARQEVNRATAKALFWMHSGYVGTGTSADEGSSTSYTGAKVQMPMRNITLTDPESAVSDSMTGGKAWTNNLSPNAQLQDPGTATFQPQSGKIRIRADFNLLMRFDFTGVIEHFLGTDATTPQFLSRAFYPHTFQLDVTCRANDRTQTSTPILFRHDMIVGRLELDDTSRYAPGQQYRNNTITASNLNAHMNINCSGVRYIPAGFGGAGNTQYYDFEFFFRAFAMTAHSRLGTATWGNDGLLGNVLFKLHVTNASLQFENLRGI